MGHSQEPREYQPMVLQGCIYCLESTGARGEGEEKANATLILEKGKDEGP